MNLGQIYETVLGWAGEKLGLKFATPIFDGATTEEEVDEDAEDRQEVKAVRPRAAPARRARRRAADDGEGLDRVAPLRR